MRVREIGSQSHQDLLLLLSCLVLSRSCTSVQGLQHSTANGENESEGRGREEERERAVVEQPLRFDRRR